MPALLPLCAVLALLSGCASQQGSYPSLSIRDAERVSGSFQPVEPEPFIPARQSPETLEQIGALQATAREAHTRFAAAAERARGPVSAGRRGGQGSDAWSIAQVTLANLESIRSEAMLALAELDQIYIDTLVEGGDTAEVETALREVEALIESEDDSIGALYREIGG